MAVISKQIGKTGSKFSAKLSPVDKSWRLVHDGKKVLDLFEGEGTTGTKFNLFCATTQQECLDEIKRLGLESPE